MDSVASPPPPDERSLAAQVRRAVIWRSGSQIVAQLVQWAATFLVIRILAPSDYGLFAMCQVVLTFMAMLNGYGLASGLIQQKTISHTEVRQLFGMLILLNVGLAVVQLAVLAPLASAYYRQPIVGDMLRVQALLYLTTPFIALPYALLSRAMDFRHQAKANIVASIASASAALGGALYGLGVWTLVLAPIVLFTVRGAMMTASARSLVWPSFDFRGAGGLARYGGIMAAGQLFWFLQSQVDVFIAGRSFSPHMLGIYTTSLFLTQIFVAKFVPPLNEVAFSAYARMQHDADAIARAFVRAVRIVMVVAMPFYMGLAATAEPLVLTVLGEKWRETAPVVHLLALAMPFMTLQVLFTPACDARGRPGIGVRNGATGAAILGVAFLVGVHWGPTGMGLAWIAAYPLYLAISAWRSLPVIGARLRDVADAVASPTLAGIAMALIVALVDDALPAILPGIPVALRLGLLVAIGAVVYGGWMLVFSRGAVRELIAIVRKRPVTD
ncbi:lipopolysaccharide biosynthesis protein [Sphingomonas ginsenosidivorax]|uniref:Lipopolysaccharide biosynthesis protein n=1 Tax=Sphingomonas ginsenosidivorax TaxID=862135 RepID=A0A5C6UH95_9SPHN|nr:lipopolysaccharide biosynthesis protein [Sphingomonas ginsenosidivorax]TXC72143.1 lipopolysaccharide biosynthesis protein [Sphingomonas ginsenosidivorax]